MLANPEYKQRMKDLCARDLCDPRWITMPPTAINITIDADCEEEYLATSWRSPDGHSKADPDGFWTRNTGKADKKAQEKKAQEKRDAEEITIGIIEENTVLKNWYADHGFVHTGTKKFPHLPFTVGFMTYMLKGK